MRLRAERLGLSAAPMALASETNLANILATLAEGKRPDLVVVDSIQTLWADGLEAAPAPSARCAPPPSRSSATPRRKAPPSSSSATSPRTARSPAPRSSSTWSTPCSISRATAAIAFRILRAGKNRFGATDEIGVFEMAAEGLREVANPSELFLGDRAGFHAGIGGVRGRRRDAADPGRDPGACGAVGARHARRAVVGWDTSRLAMLLAVIDARCGISFAQHDVYLNVAGGLKITEPAADLAAAAALLSSFTGRPAPEDTVYFGR